jgi:glycosyltransferase involved in cell wall biosynthesis
MGELVLVTGRDPTLHSSGAENYMAAQALCARHLGYEPHMFVVGRRSKVFETDFGTVHRVASPVRLTVAHGSVLHRRLLTPAVVRFLRARPGPHLIQGHAGWARIATDAASRLTSLGIPTRSFALFYSTVEHEQTAKYEGALVQSDLRRRLAYAFLVAWVRAASVPNERAGYLRADRVAVNYENVRRLLAEAYGERTDVERVAYCAPTAFRPDASPTGSGNVRGADGMPPLIVSVSRHSARKGLDVLIRALAELRERGVAFRAMLVGAGRMLAAHRRLADQLGVAGLVTFPGIVPDPLPYLRECDVFVLPSTAEDSGSLSVLEALQLGAPVVASAVDGLPEDLTDGRDALLVPAGDPHALANAIARLLADPELRGAISRAALETYEARFTAERASADLARVYENLGLEVPARVQ